MHENKMKEQTPGDMEDMDVEPDRFMWFTIILAEYRTRMRGRTMLKGEKTETVDELKSDHSISQSPRTVDTVLSDSKDQVCSRNTVVVILKDAR